MNGETYLSATAVRKRFGVSSNTLRRWSEQGKLRCLRPNGTRRIYNSNDIEKFFGVEEEFKEKKTVIYARVSSQHQREDLERQIKFIETKYPGSRVYKDIGSGLNWQRQGFKALLESIYEGSIGSVVVSYRDRLCRFGVELVEWFFKKHNVELVVLNESNDDQDSSKELSDDLLAITTVFVARNNGLRAGKYRRERRKSSSGKND